MVVIEVLDNIIHELNWLSEAREDNGVETEIEEIKNKIIALKNKLNKAQDPFDLDWNEEDEKRVHTVITDFDSVLSGLLPDEEGEYDDDFDDYEDYPTVLYLNGEEYIGRNEALKKILQTINNLKTPEEYNNFAISWFDYEDDEEGDVVVSIYSANEVEESDIYGDADVEEKCSVWNDKDAWEHIKQALAAKQEELLNN